jgi:hypothetical protein
MNNDLYNPKDRVHRVMDWVLYTTITVGVSYWVYAFYQALGR